MYRLPVYEGVLSVRAEKELEDKRKRSPAKVLRDDPSARVVDEAAMSEFIEYKN